MDKFTISMDFAFSIEMHISAKDKKTALQKAYKKLDKMAASKYIDKSKTDITKY